MPQAASMAGSLEEQPSPLLRLPAELREHIYRYVLVNDEPIAIPSQSWTLGFPLDPSDPPFTCTCRQIRSEALAIFYSENIFTDRLYGAGCEYWFLQLPPEKLGMLSEARIEMPYGWCKPDHNQRALDTINAAIKATGVTMQPGALYVRIWPDGPDDTDHTCAVWSSSPASDAAALQGRMSRLRPGDRGQTWRVVELSDTDRERKRSEYRVLEYWE